MPMPPQPPASPKDVSSEMMAPRTCTFEHLGVSDNIMTNTKSSNINMNNLNVIGGYMNNNNKGCTMTLQQKQIASALPRFVSAETQLRYALEAFEYAHFARLGPNWALRYNEYFLDAGIDSMNALLMGCKENTVNLDLEFIGVRPEDRLTDEIMQYLINFLPGPVGLRCFRLAQMAAEKVRKGEADVKYVHRPENGKAGDEVWHIITTPHHSRHNSSDVLGNALMMTAPPKWKLHVDCAGFVRSVLKHITKDLVQVSLSDRSFMRAKDFFRFFETLENTVTDKEDLPQAPPESVETITGSTRLFTKWRLIRDLRMVIPGDIIVYRPKGNAAGNTAFTKNDRSDLKHLLKAVKTAQLWRAEHIGKPRNHLVTFNVAKDPRIKPFVEKGRKNFAAVGIHSCTHLREKFDTLNEMLIAKGLEPFDEETMLLMKECAATTALNTGHIVFASGPAVLKDPDTMEFRVKVVHSTSNGKTVSGRKTQGVQQYYRRFQLAEGPNGPIWTRQMKKGLLPEEIKKKQDAAAAAAAAQKSETEEEEVEDDDGDNDVDEDDPDEEKEEKDADDVPEEEAGGGDELAGMSNVEVLAARMCF